MGADESARVVVHLARRWSTWTGRVDTGHTLPDRFCAFRAARARLDACSPGVERAQTGARFFYRNHPMPALPAIPAAASYDRSDGKPRVRPMPRSRMVLVSLVVAAILVGQLYDTAVDGDHWPFSSYPMFARPREGLVRLRRLYGVTAAGEVPLVVPRHLAPFHEARLMTAFKRLGRLDDPALRLTAAFHGVLEIYQERRRAGAHDGPMLDGVRLYLVTWPLAPAAANRDVPATRQLLGEVLW
jgi:hypothetical protein